MFVETEFAHSGIQCIGMEVWDISKSRRAEFNIKNMQELVGDEATVSAWLYLPEDFNLNIPGINWNWFALGTIRDVNPPSWVPYFEPEIIQPDITKKVFDVAVIWRDLDGTLHYLSRTNNFPLPLGKWFNIKYYTYRHETNGKLQIWLDGQLICNNSEILTKYVDEWYISIAKVYTGPNEPQTQYVWIDDLEIWSGHH